MNTPARLPSFVHANTSWINMVDRCALFPQKERKGEEREEEEQKDCPTFNTEACYSVAHKIPGLAERYVLMDDDMLFTRPVTPEVFFDPANGKARIYVNRNLSDEEIE